MNKKKSVTVGITGGSGSIYAIKLLQILPKFYETVNVILSGNAKIVLLEEVNITVPESGIWTLNGLEKEEYERLIIWNNQNYNAPFASGSNCSNQMVIIPCSLSTVASIAHGIDMNLLHHSAAVTIKEKKQLIIVPRETPLSTIHLKNLLTLSELGISIIPAMPGFYGGQKTFDDLINFVVQKVLNHLTIDYNISKKWRD
ncbi:MAG: UbiX family flavin prenyltransferase [Chlorobiota bacterium]|nr:UbiX family flavin prenyltransferase [Chlorobiota bacterium]QQS66199.1 MAG: UbiX family flavin prenyltransferase [Chlorobiota bacterium]